MATILFLSALGLAGVLYIVSRRGSIDGVELIKVTLILAMFGICGHYLLSQIEDNPKKENLNSATEIKLKKDNSEE